MFNITYTPLLSNQIILSKITFFRIKLYLLDNFLSNQKYSKHEANNIRTSWKISNKDHSFSYWVKWIFFVDEIPFKSQNIKWKIFGPVYSLKYITITVCVLLEVDESFGLIIDRNIPKVNATIAKWSRTVTAKNAAEEYNNGRDALHCYSHPPGAVLHSDKWHTDRFSVEDTKFILHGFQHCESPWQERKTVACCFQKSRRRDTEDKKKRNGKNKARSCKSARLS